ncbi:MAG: Smr/MutS family protein [Bacilli bacterium]
MLRNTSYNLPTLDLHGEDRVNASILVKEFINDQYSLHNEYLRIIHGNGYGIIKEEVGKCLKSHPLVVEYSVDMYNAGCTCVKIKRS